MSSALCGVDLVAKKPNLTIVKPATTSGNRPSRTLGKHGLVLWNAIVSTYDVSDEGGREILCQACLAQDRVEQLAAQIEADGPTILLKGILREHPCLRAELAGRAFITRSLVRLGLNVESVKGVGRPPGYSPPTKAQCAFDDGDEE